MMNLSKEAVIAFCEEIGKQTAFHVILEGGTWDWHEPYKHQLQAPEEGLEGLY
jgi:hypothetical protein